MKFLILNTDYPGFRRWLYAQHPGLAKQPYEEQMQAWVESLFGVADFYSGNLRKLGHEAWAREHGVHIDEPTPVKQRVRTVLQCAHQIAAKTALPILQVNFLLRVAIVGWDLSATMTSRDVQKVIDFALLQYGFYERKNKPKIHLDNGS